MTDRHVDFRPYQVRAALAGRLSQTRRVVKNVTDMPPPRCHPAHTPKRAAPYLDAYCGEPKTSLNPRGMGHDWYWWQVDDRLGPFAFRLPYATGDRLWVREAWAMVPVSAYRASEGVDQRQSPFDYEAAIYRAGFDRSQGGIHWRSPIHMPRWASRLTLLVTDVRVQRLQEISSADAIAEGCPPYANSATIDCDTPNPRDDFKRLWNGIHGPDAWDANPWVAAISFTVHRCNIDKMEEGTW